LAAARLAREAPGHTLDATALVHEAYLRVVGADHFDHRGHFFAAAAEAMRRILIDNARRKQADRHGGGWQRHDLLEAELAVDSTGDDLLAVDEALSRLAAREPVIARLVELRFFAGLTLDEAARCLGMAPRTAYRHWAYARAWLRRELDRTNEDNSSREIISAGLPRIVAGPAAGFRTVFRSAAAGPRPEVPGHERPTPVRAIHQRRR
ncbi:MAG TPA: ECF-type sigma factor, partial [Gemmataceae bacterium]|nr:ECF-type sigma factor [Gemmataceae bacterium]